MTQEAIAQLAADLARDEGGILTAAERERSLASALARYSVDCPLLLTARVRFDDAGFVRVPATWADGSVVRGATSGAREIDIATVIEGGRRRPRWLTASGAKSATVHYTAPHTWESVPQQHELPVAQFAAYLLCEQLAIFYSAQRESAITGAASLTEQRATLYARRAEELRAAYFAGIGQVDPLKDAQAAASGGPAAATAAWGRINPRYRLTGWHGVAAGRAEASGVLQEDEDMATNSYTRAESDARYALQTQLAEYAKKIDLPSAAVFVPRTELDAQLALYAKRAEIPAAPDLSPYALKSELPNTSSFATAAQLAEALAGKADKSELPDTSSFVTSSGLVDVLAAREADLRAEIAAKVDKADVPDTATFIGRDEWDETMADIATTQTALLPRSELARQLAPYALKSDVPDVSLLATNTGVQQALAAKADKSELPDMAEYARRSDVAECAQQVQVNAHEALLAAHDERIGRLEGAAGAPSSLAEVVQMLVDAGVGRQVSFLATQELAMQIANLTNPADCPNGGIFIGGLCSDDLAMFMYMDPSRHVVGKVEGVDAAAANGGTWRRSYWGASKDWCNQTFAKK